jgi:hypothetical protein
MTEDAMISLRLVSSAVGRLEDLVMTVGPLQVLHFMGRVVEK